MDDLSVDPVIQNNVGGKGGFHQVKSCTIRVLGIGGGGCNSLQHMINQSLSGVEFIAINTDADALNRSTAPLKVQIGVKLTNGLGAGCDPNIGRKAAEESKEDVKKLLQGSNMVFIAAGMGGGTGTGAAPVIAEIAQEVEALTLAVVTKPFHFEGPRKKLNAQAGITELSKHVDSLIILDNEKLLKNLGTNISIINALHEADDVLYNAVKGITETIRITGYMNLDYADIRTITAGRGHAMIGSGVGQGANFVEDAIQRAIHSPLIDQMNIKCATGLMVNTRANPNFPIAKWDQLCRELQSYADEEADCKFGLVFDDQIAEDQISITILITGMSINDPNAQEPQVSARTNAAMRRNSLGPSSPVSENTDFFRHSQNQGGMSAQGGMQTMRPAAQGGVPMEPHRVSPVRQQSQSYGMQGQSREQSIEEINDTNENWDVPTIFRKKI